MTSATLRIVVVSTCLATVAVTADAQIRAAVYASGFSRPLGFVQDPVMPSVQYVVEQGGHIRVVSDGVVHETDFLDLSDLVSQGGEQGLLGLAFAPDYATSRRLFVDFTNADGAVVIARFLRSEADPFTVDPGSRFDLRWGGPDGLRYIVKPFENHNGGRIEFGPDGYLYIGIGD